MKKNRNKQIALLATIMSMAVAVGPVVSSVSAQEATGIAVTHNTQPEANTKESFSSNESLPNDTTTTNPPPSSLDGMDKNTSIDKEVESNFDKTVSSKDITEKKSTDDSEKTTSDVNPVTGDIPINETTFPDANFRKFVNDTYGTDGKLTKEKIASTTSIYIISENITSLKGIEYFTALAELGCGENKLTTLDISNNTALTYLDCIGNELTTLDLSNNTALTFLDCADNQLISLDLSNNTALETLQCSNNPLTSLDLPNNAALKTLKCNNNRLTTLDVSNNTALTELQCANSQLTSLNLFNNTHLTDLICNDNPLTTLDVSNNTYLSNLICNDNQLTSLNLSKNTALTYLKCRNNQLTELNLSTNIALFYLDCMNNQLTSLDVSKNTALTHLACSDNKLICLILPNPHSLNVSFVSPQTVNSITATDTFDLTTLAPSIDSSKITELKGATLTGTTLSAFKVGQDITYTYKANDSNSINVTIKVKLANSWTTPLSIENWKYGETPKAPAAVASHGTPKFVYSNAETGTYTDKVPTSAGNWYVKAIVDETDGYLGLESKPVAFEITKAPVTETDIKVPTITPDEKVLYGQTLADIKLPNGWIWVEPTTVVTVNNSGYAARLAVDDANYDYTGVDGYVGDVTTFSAAPTSHYVERKIIVAVAQAPAPAITEPTDLITTTGNTLAQITLPEGWSWTDNTQKVATGSNGYAAKLAVDDTTYDYTDVAGYNAEGHYVTRTLTVQGTAAPNGGGTIEPGGNPGDDQDNSNQNINNLDDTNGGNNVKTGDSTASIAGGLSVAAILSACTAWFVSKKKKN